LLHDVIPKRLDMVATFEWSQTGRLGNGPWQDGLDDKEVGEGVQCTFTVQCIELAVSGTRFESEIGYLRITEMRLVWLVHYRNSPSTVAKEKPSTLQEARSSSQSRYLQSSHCSTQMVEE
jgi:hypothetical protein